MEARLGLTSFRYRPYSFSRVNHVVAVMLASLYLHEKDREVSIKTKPAPASLPAKGQVTEQTTVK